MAITSLQNTAWIINSGFAAYMVPEAGGYKIEHDLYQLNPVSNNFVAAALGRNWFYIGRDANNTYGNYLWSYKSNNSGTANPNLSFPVNPGNYAIIFREDPTSGNLANLISWLGKNAVLVEPLKVEGSIEYDSTWIAEECHANDFDHVLTLTWKVYSGDITNFSGTTTVGSHIISKKATLTFGDLLSPKFSMEVPLTTTNTNLTHKTYSANVGDGYRQLDVYTYTYKLSNVSLNTLSNWRTSEGWLNVVSKMVLTDDLSRSYPWVDSTDYFLEFPPKGVANLKADLVVSNPGELKCSWSKAEVYNALNERVDGYYIELYRSPAEALNEYVQIEGLDWEVAEKAKGIYKIVKTSKPSEDIKIPTAETGEDPVLSFGFNKYKPEVCIEDPDKTEVFFTPKSLGIMPGDGYKIIIYPYSHYIDVYGGWSHSRLAVATELGGGKVSKGVVRIMHEGIWKEGQVWVMTDNGWKQAEAIYAKTVDGWKEAQ